MASIEISSENLVIHIHGLDKFLALRSSLTVPLRSIKSVTARPPDARGEGEIKAYRIAGAFIPGSVTAGYFWVSGGLGTSPRPSLHALDRAKVAIEEWTYEGGSHKQHALEHVSRAIEEVTQGATEAQMPLDDEGKGWAFYDLHDASKTIGLDVDHGKIRRIVVQVDDETPNEVVERIKEAIARVS